MKKINIFILNFVLVLIAVSFVVSGSKAEEVSLWKEVIQLGRVTFIVGEGTKVRRSGHLVVIESNDEYMRRKFVEIREHFIAVDKKQEEFDKEVKRQAGEIQRIKNILKLR